jgi:hypothetical protein
MKRGNYGFSSDLSENTVRSRFLINKKMASDCSDENLRGYFDDGVPNYTFSKEKLPEAEFEWKKQGRRKGTF